MRKRQFALVLMASIAAPVWAASRTVTLSVPGMDCPVCPITIKKALNKVPGVLDAKIDFPKREATVTFDDAKASVDALAKATRDAGYPSTLARSGK